MSTIKDKLIAAQELEIASLQEQVAMKDEALSKISNMLVRIGGPLNDPRVKHSEEALVTFHRILMVVQDHDTQAPKEKPEYDENTRVLETMRHASGLERDSDFSVRISFLSVRSCSAFLHELKVARKLPAYETLIKQINHLSREATHWEANHADVVQRLALATDRTDLPLHRTVAYREVTKYIDALRSELASTYGEVLARVHFHPSKEEPRDYDIHDSSSFRSRPPDCSECVEAVIVKRAWRCLTCNGSGVVGASTEGSYAEAVCTECDSGFIRNSYTKPREMIKPNPDAVAALALQGHLEANQAAEVLEDAGLVPKSTNPKD